MSTEAGNLLRGMRLAAWIAGLLVLVMIGWIGSTGNALAADDDGGTPNALLKGRYSFPIEVTGNRSFGVGVFTADGRGNITEGIRILVSPVHSTGPPVRHLFTGSYSINPDGTGTAVIVTTDPPDPSPLDGYSWPLSLTQHWDFVVMDGGQEIWYVARFQEADGTWAEKPTMLGWARKQTPPCDDDGYQSDALRRMPPAPAYHLKDPESVVPSPR